MMIHIPRYNSKAEAQRLRRLVERFEAGETSVAEEQKLFARFAPGKKVPADLEPLRPMMQWYASMAPASTKRRGSTVVKWVGVAASLAVVATLAVGLMRSATDPDFASRGGSYVITNGVKNTNIAAILPDLDRAESTVKRIKELRHNMPDEVDMSNPYVRKAIERRYQDEYVANYYTAK